MVHKYYQFFILFGILFLWLMFGKRDKKEHLVFDVSSPQKYWNELEETRKGNTSSVLNTWNHIQNIYDCVDYQLYSFSEKNEFLDKDYTNILGPKNKSEESILEYKKERKVLCDTLEEFMTNNTVQNNMEEMGEMVDKIVKDTSTLFNPNVRSFYDSLTMNKQMILQNNSKIRIGIYIKNENQHAPLLFWTNLNEITGNRYFEIYVYQIDRLEPILELQAGNIDIAYVEEEDAVSIGGSLNEFSQTTYADEMYYAFTGHDVLFLLLCDNFIYTRNKNKEQLPIELYYRTNEYPVNSVERRYTKRIIPAVLSNQTNIETISETTPDIENRIQETIIKKENAQQIRSALDASVKDTIIDPNSLELSETDALRTLGLRVDMVLLASHYPSSRIADTFKNNNTILNMKENDNIGRNYPHYRYYRDIPLKYYPELNTRKKEKTFNTYGTRYCGLCRRDIPTDVISFLYIYLMKYSIQLTAFSYFQTWNPKRLFDNRSTMLYHPILQRIN